MKKSFKYKLVSLLAIVGSLFLLAGCKFNFTLDETMKDKGLGALVTYHANAAGASFGNSVESDGSNQRLTLGFYTGNYAMNIGFDKLDNGTVQTPSLNGYTLEGWYFAATDIDGNVLTENGYVVLGEKVDFSQPLQDGDEWNVYAKWTRNAFISVILAGEVDDSTTFEIRNADGVYTTYKVGDEIKTYTFVDGKRDKLSSPGAEKEKDYTFLHYYADADCTQEVSWPLKAEETDTHTVYAKYIKGNWTVIEDAKGLQSYFAGGAVSASGAVNAYLFDADKDNVIDCAEYALNPIANFGGVFAGNGVTLKNVSVSVGDRLSGIATASLFGNIQEGAKIENVTFENVSMTAGLMPNASLRIFFMFTSLAEMSAVENVTFKGALSMSLTVPDGALVPNMIRDDTWHKEHLFFGGDIASVNDQTYLETAGFGVKLDAEKTITVTVNDVAI